MHHPTDRITQTMAFVTPVVEHWLEREIAHWVHSMKDRSDDPSQHERTLLPRSYISLQLDLESYHLYYVSILHIYYYFYLYSKSDTYLCNTIYLHISLDELWTYFPIDIVIEVLYITKRQWFLDLGHQIIEFVLIWTMNFHIHWLYGKWNRNKYQKPWMKQNHLQK